MSDPTVKTFNLDAEIEVVTVSKAILKLVPGHLMGPRSATSRYTFGVAMDDNGNMRTYHMPPTGERKEVEHFLETGKSKELDSRFFDGDHHIPLIDFIMLLYRESRAQTCLLYTSPSPRDS